jgi:hypothetical protein
MNEEKKVQIQFICDLLELKSISLKNESLSIHEGIIARNNHFYLVIDSLIALFVDKYKINYDDVKKEFYNKKFENNN